MLNDAVLIAQSVYDEELEIILLLVWLVVILELYPLSEASTLLEELLKYLEEA